ncbi:MULTISPECIES: hypothetical protein [Ramlibacter]|uniref:Uncharacterized protein n=1 Tax=Ramlibacter pinisoli TaxID=2682844 RepID=A0A6N8IWG9_9BURK|nr:MULTISPECIES: hypothetical protein [Ramlibacter]MBA2960949.1 hypothetical protein [Ramlibacter sp. CGMCC 1.13660]MVQ30895.1 hypothetical protein [Ramlibacter pinisoli]
MLAAKALPRLVAFLVVGVMPLVALSWVYPEHRILSLLAVQQLDSERRAVFDHTWELARSGDEARLCAAGADQGQGTAPSCIDWAALSAIAGDHSCSSLEMMETARGAPWILQVADVGAQLKEDLARIPMTPNPDALDRSADLISGAQRSISSEAVRAQRVNALRTADIRLQRADPQYVTRAGSNNAHFLLSRPQTTTTLADYAELSLRPGSDISAIGIYSYLHLSALQKASRLAAEPQLSAAGRAALARAALADEAFALHFLQDAFAAGHISGTWGDRSQRQGTHDYYNHNGLEVFTWSGGSRSVVLMGDAYMRSEDADFAAKTVRTSLEQVLDVASGRVPFAHAPAAASVPDGFDVCRNTGLPAREPELRLQPEQRQLFAATLLDTPVPGLGPGFGAMPRFRSEVGPFVGLAGTIDGRVVDGGFSDLQTRRGGVAGLDLSFRAGFGLDGVTSEAGDGLVYASIGLRSDGPSANRFNDTFPGSGSGNLSAAIPARAGVSLRFRMPFYVVPGDLLLLSPMYFIDRQAYAKMAVTAGNGGLIPWQSGWATGIGRFQFVLGRELGITLYGLDDKDQLVVPRADASSQARVVNFKSVSYDLPIFEYRPYRSFSSNQSSSVVFQLFAAADVPYGGSTVFPPGAPTPGLHTVWSLGVRMVFDWRHYFSY